MMDIDQITDTAGRRNLIVGLLSLGFGLSYGLNYGVSNHNSYLLQGLRLARPDILNSDWLVKTCSDYHFIFSYLVKWLYMLSPSGWSFAVANVVTVAAGGIIIYLILAHFVRASHAVLAHAILLGLLAVTRTDSIGGSYLFAFIFQPSSLGGLGFLAAALFFLRRQYLLSGFAWGLGGLFHVNYLILGIIVFGLAHLLLGWRGLPSRLARQMILPLLALTPYFDLIFASVGTNDPLVTRVGQQILFDIRSPHHYQPLFFYREFIPFLGWLIIGLATGWRRRSSVCSSGPSRALFLAMLIPLIVATCLTSLVFIPKVAQVYVFRIAPVLILLCQVMLVIRIMDIGTQSEPSQGLQPSCLVLLVVGAIMINCYLSHGLVSMLIITAIMTGIFLYEVRKSPAGRARVAQAKRLAIASLVIWVVGTAPFLAQLGEHSSLIRGLPAGEDELFGWTRQVESSAIFLIPPDLENFRYHAERAVVVDWKTAPVVPAELVSWYGRIQAVSGTSNPKTLDQVVRGYANLSCVDLVELKRTYDFDYAVLRKLQEQGQCANWETVFAGSEFLVIRPVDLAAAAD